MNPWVGSLVRVAFLVILLVVGWPLPGLGQNACRVVNTLPDSSVRVVIGDKTMVAISESVEQMYMEMEAVNRNLKEKLKIKDSLLAESDTARDRWQEAVKRQQAYVSDLDSLYRGYRRLADDYRRLSSEPRLSFGAGLGYTGDTKPAVLAGLGVGHVWLWGFLQEQNAGGFLGVNMRVW